MTGWEEYADAQARADDGQPAQPGDPEVIAAGDERLGWEQTRYQARRQDEADWERLDPVGIPEIATRLGVERQTVDQWRLRGRLPGPDRVVGGRPVWAWATIRDWAVGTGRLPEDG